MHACGYTDRLLSDAEIAALVEAALAQEDLDGKRVLVLIPDGTRTAPIPLMFRLLHRALAARTAALCSRSALATSHSAKPPSNAVTRRSCNTQSLVVADRKSSRSWLTRITVPP